MLLMEDSSGTSVGRPDMHSESCLSGVSRVSRRRERGGRLISSSTVSTGPASSPTLALASLLLFFTPRTVDGFFRPSTRVKAPPPGPKSLSSLPQNRDQHTLPLVLPIQKHAGGSSEISVAALRRRFPWLLMSAAEEAGETESIDEQLVKSDEDSGEESVGMPSIDLPDMMGIEERTRLWMAVARLEGEATRLERQGEKEEAFNLRARANKMRYEDPYTALQDELDEAIKNEELVKIARLRLQMRRLGVPPNAEMQARAEGRDPRSATAEAARQMPGMTNRESEMLTGSRSGTRADGTIMTEGYSSKSDTTTHGVRVEVRSQYYPEQSNPLKDQYIFVYKVKITNQSPQTVQLVSRTWEIKAVEASEAPQVVKGPGVVGQQPVLEPGQSFEYSSACPITCAPKEGYQVLGRMKGSYLIVMGAVGEAAFEAKIDPFYLILPQSVLDERARGNKGGGNAGGGDVAGSW